MLFPGSAVESPKMRMDDTDGELSVSTPPIFRAVITSCSKKRKGRKKIQNILVEMGLNVKGISVVICPKPNKTKTQDTLF